jgi:hypothetical protein
MGLLDRNTECCGANFENNNISILGVFLISCPFIIVYWIFSPVLLPINYFRKNSFLMSTIYKANVELIKKITILPNLKCIISGKLYFISPRLSGWCYKNFNLICLLIMWLMAILLTYGVKILWP